MSVTREEFERFNATMHTLSDAAISDLEDMLGKVWRYAGNSRRDALDMLVKSYAPALAEKYGLSAASVSAALWEDIYHNDTGARLEALIPEHDDFEDSFGDAAVNIVAKKADDEDYEGALSFLTGITAKALYDWARKTQVSNTQHVVSKHKKGADQARFARIPTGDETCAFCLMLAGRGFVYLSELTAGGGPEHGTEFDSYHPYCVTGDTKVSGPAILDGLARDYSGPLIQLVTATGRKLSVTPEHPILTSRGWVIADELTEDADLVCARRFDWHVMGVPDEQDAPPTIKDVVGSLLVRDALLSGRVPAAPEDFYGKVANSEIDIVDTDCLLSDIIEPESVKRVGDEPFTGRLDFGICSVLFDSQGPSNLGVDGCDATTDCIVCPCGLRIPFFGSHPRGPDDAGSTATPTGDTGFIEPSVDDNSANPSSLGDRQDALTSYVGIGNPVGHGNASFALMLASANFDASLFDVPIDCMAADTDRLLNLAQADAFGIELDRLISKVTIDSWVGHVYDLHTVDGWYASNGIITHNCDCLIVSSFDPTPTLEGYDPTVYERMYGESRAYDAKGRVDLSQTLSNMRRNYGLK